MCTQACEKKALLLMTAARRSMLIYGAFLSHLFFSVKYHLLHPDYIHKRLKDLGKNFELRILLLLADAVSSFSQIQNSDCAITGSVADYDSEVLTD